MDIPGYRSLPEKQVERLELFLAALQVYWNLWATGGTHIYPSMRLNLMIV